MTETIKYHVAALAANAQISVPSGDMAGFIYWSVTDFLFLCYFNIN